MLLDAFRSELYRFGKNRAAVFWSLAFVPLVFLIGGIIAAHFITSKIKEASPDIAEVGAATTNIGGALLGLSGQVANAATLAFLIIGAATLFAGDYRWETWRLISSRNTRVNLLGGKLLTLGVMIIIATLALLVAGFVVLACGAIFSGSSLELGLTGAQWGQMGLLVALGLARLVQVLMLCLLAAVVTRSLLAALFVPIAISIAQAMAQNFTILLQIMPTDWQAIFMSPGLAVDHLKAGIVGGLPPAMASQITGLSLASLAGWIVVPLILSFVLFQRQAMSKE